MIIDGEKYACEACVRGHRVSNCQHSERPLQHINKKGRPVSQCAHCRSMRKSRTAHVKCDCGEKTSKCAHLQSTIEGHTETCCCNHGGRCTCAHKKEPSLDTVHESDSEQDMPEIPAPAANVTPSTSHHKPPIRRRRANTIHADGGLFFDENGHHKPIPKHNRAAQKCTPYHLNRVSSTNSASSLGAGVEGLSFTHSDARNTPKSLTCRERRVKSETASPLMSSAGFPVGSNLPSLDLSGIDNAAYVGGSFDLFSGGFDPDGPMYSAGLSAASVDWTSFDPGESRSSRFVYEFSSGSEQLPHLANTTSTSGDVSEVEDVLPGAENDLDGFGGGSFLRQNLIPTGTADLTSIDYDSFYKNAETVAMPGSVVSLVEEDPAFWLPNYNESIATVEESADLGASTANNFWQM